MGGRLHVRFMLRHPFPQSFQGRGFPGIFLHVQRVGAHERAGIVLESLGRRTHLTKEIAGQATRTQLPHCLGADALVMGVYVSEQTRDLGPLGRLVYLDYVGATDAAIAHGMPGIFLVATLGLLGVAVLGRRRQLRLRRRGR